MIITATSGQTKVFESCLPIADNWQMLPKRGHVSSDFSFYITSQPLGNQ